MVGFPQYKNISAPDLSNLIALQSRGTNNAFNSLADIGNTIQNIQTQNKAKESRNLLAQGMLEALNRDPNIKNTISEAVNNESVPLDHVSSLINLQEKQDKIDQQLKNQKTLLNFAGLPNSDIVEQGSNIVNTQTLPLNENIFNQIVNAKNKLEQDKRNLDGAKLLAQYVDTVDPSNTATNLSLIPSNHLSNLNLTDDVANIIKNSPKVKQEQNNKDFNIKSLAENILQSVPIFTNSNKDTTKIGPYQPKNIEEYLSNSLSGFSKEFQNEINTIQNNKELTNEQKEIKINTAKENYLNNITAYTANFAQENQVDEETRNVFSVGSPFNTNSNSLSNTSKMLNMYDTVKNRLPKPIYENSLINSPENIDLRQSQQSRIEENIYTKNLMKNSKVLDNSIDERANTEFKDITTPQDYRVFAEKITRDREDGPALQKLAVGVKNDLENNSRFKSLNKKINYSKLASIISQNIDPQTTLLGYVVGDGITDSSKFYTAMYLASEDPEFKTKLDVEKGKILTAVDNVNKIDNSLTKLENRLASERKLGINTLQTEQDIENLKNIYKDNSEKLFKIKDDSKKILNDYLKDLGYVPKPEPKKPNTSKNVPIATS